MALGFINNQYTETFRGGLSIRVSPSHPYNACLQWSNALSVHRIHGHLELFPPLTPIASFLPQEGASASSGSREMDGERESLCLRDSFQHSDTKKIIDLM